KMTFVRNPNYWDKPRPYIDTIVQKEVSDPAQRFNAFQAGQGDVTVLDNTKANQDMVKSVGGTNYGYAPAGGGIEVALNENVGPLNDVRIRQALVLATDLNDLNLKATGGVGHVVDTFFVKGTPQYNASVRQGTNNLKAAQKLIDQVVAEKGPITLTFSLY